MKVCVFGAKGFVGAGVTRALRESGVDVIHVRAPRMSVPWGTTYGQWEALEGSLDVVAPVVAVLNGSSVVVNCAGIPSPSAGQSPALYGANAILPSVLRYACRSAGVARFVHVSSAAVQGQRAVLDETEQVSPLTPYGWSKADGERFLLLDEADRTTTIFRATSVHGVDRRTTAQLASFARSRYSSVAGRGEWASPQVLVQNVGSAVARLVTSSAKPPPIVLQPSEFQTARSVLHVLGLGQEPHHIPKPLAHALVAAMGLAIFGPRLASARRRLQVLWFGQRQAAGWLETQGFTPPTGIEGWTALAEALAAG